MSVIFTSGKIQIILVSQNHISNASGLTILLILDGSKANGLVFLFNLFIYLDFVGVRVQNISNLWPKVSKMADIENGRY